MEEREIRWWFWGGEEKRDREQGATMVGFGGVNGRGRERERGGGQ